jgi:hypothetical protein
MNRAAASGCLQHADGGGPGEAPGVRRGGGTHGTTPRVQVTKALPVAGPDTRHGSLSS